MCELKAIFKGEVVFEGVVYARDDRGAVVLRNILGNERKIEGCRIKEINIGKELLQLSRV